MARRAEARSTPPTRPALPLTDARERDLKTLAPLDVIGWAIGPAPRVGKEDPTRQPSEEDKRWLVYEIRDGELSSVTPLRYGRAWGESLSSAAARIQRALQDTLPKLGRTRK